MPAERRPRAAKSAQVAIALLLVVVYAAFLVLALVRGKWSVALVLAPFLLVAIVMLRQRRRDGEPVSFLTTVVRLLGHRGRR